MGSEGYSEASDPITELTVSPWTDTQTYGQIDERACKFYDIDKSAPPKKLFFKVDANNYF